MRLPWVKSEYFNDDKLGRVLDKIYELGLTQLFIEIVLVVIKTFKIDIKYGHLDSTSFHLHGEYKVRRNSGRRWTNNKRKTHYHKKRLFKGSSTRFKTMCLRLDSK